jgi:hypothetical protein
LADTGFHHTLQSLIHIFTKDSPSFDALPDALIALMLEHEILFWNRAAGAIFA